MQKVTVNTQNGSSKYDVIIGDEITDELTGLLQNSEKATKVLFICDTNTHRLFYEKYSSILKDQRYDIYDYTVAPGENSKSLIVLGEILEFLTKIRFTRTDIIIALGGGVIGDLAGFVSSVYLRGIDFYQIPTTLLADVDSSIGGKTGINLHAGKNLAGTFWQPCGVLCDISNLATLPKENKLDGIAEIIKYGMICDRELFDLTTVADLDDNLIKIIERCVEIKAEIVSKDEKDKGIRNMLNFGHTIGHAIETLSEYQISHGIAIAIGMAMITRVSASAGFCDRKTAGSLMEKMDSFGFPSEAPFSNNSIIEAALSDKKISGEKINAILPVEIGKCIVEPMTLEEFGLQIESVTRS